MLSNNYNDNYSNYIFIYLFNCYQFFFSAVCSRPLMNPFIYSILKIYLEQEFAISIHHMYS